MKKNTMFFMVVGLFALNLSAQEVPEDWACDASYYDADDGCDCGCEVLDPDCADASVASCEYFGACDRGAGQVVDLQNPLTCTDNMCGDGILAGDETCDDGNVAPSDGCAADCTIEEGFECGDTPTFPFTSYCVDPPEDWTCEGALYGEGQCDCGCGIMDSDCNQDSSVEVCVSAVGCIDPEDYGEFFGIPIVDWSLVDEVVNPEDNTACVANTCGDGWTLQDEGCDDGNTEDGDGCSSTCTAEENGYCQSLEGIMPITACGVLPQGWTCSADAYTSEECDCGCGVADENCEDGTVESCDSAFGCLPEDAETWADVTNVVSSDDTTMCVANTCGDGWVVATEECDDGDTQDGDGCSSTCTVEEGYTCNVNQEGIMPRTADCVLIPDGWTCPGAAAFDETCDCGCGIADTACEDSSLESCGSILGCLPETAESWDDITMIPSAADTTTCVDNVCGDGWAVGGEECDGQEGCTAECVAAEGFSCTPAGPEAQCVESIDGWTCSPDYYGSDDGCDCGCGIDDPDCGESYTVEACEYEYCEGENGVEDLVQNNPALCMGDEPIEDEEQPVDDGEGVVDPTCNDDIQNGDETGVDCGGSCPTACEITDDEDEPAEDGDEPAEDGDEPAEDEDEPAEDGDEPAEDGDEPAEDGEESDEEDSSEDDDKGCQSTAGSTLFAVLGLLAIRRRR